MDIEERKIFWETLCSLDGMDLKKDTDLLRKTIRYPKHIYRYREVNKRTLDALRENKLYYSTSDYYDDPFDTFIHVDIKELKDFLDRAPQLIRCNSQVESLVEYILSKWLKVQVDDAQKKVLIGQLENMLPNPNFQGTMLEYVRNIRNEIKKDTWSVCFSEDGLNESLWLKYANQHKGFAVAYDLENNDNMLCGKQMECNNCRMNKSEINLFPIYYSDKKYLATQFAQFLLTFKVIGNNMNEELSRKITEDMGNQIWEKEKITLIKKLCHMYDKEWRMIAPMSFDEGPVMMKWIPDAVILGLSMEKSAEAQVIGTAYQAGIKKIYKCYINDEGDLDGYLLPLNGKGSGETG